MKRTAKILAALLTVCLLLGVICVNVFASDTKTVSNVISNVADVGQNTIFRNPTITMDGINNGVYNSKFDTVGATKTIYDEQYVSVSGNKYLQLRYSGTPYTANETSTPYFDWKIGNYTAATEPPTSLISPSLFNTDYIVLEFDIASDAYYSDVADDSGSHLTSEDTGKLAYVDGFYYSIVARYWTGSSWGTSGMTGGADGSLTTSYLDSDGDGVADTWYLVAGRLAPGTLTTTLDKIPLSPVAGVWNHISIVIDVEHKITTSKKVDYYDFSASVARVYLDGEYAFNLKKVFSSSKVENFANIADDAGYTYRECIVMNSIRFQPYDNDQNIIEQDTYSMCFDSFTASFYGDGKKDGEYSPIADYTNTEFGIDNILTPNNFGAFNKNVKLSECSDILYNASSVKADIRKAVASAKSGDVITVSASVDKLEPTAAPITIKCESGINVSLSEKAALKYKIVKTSDGYQIAPYASNELTTFEWYDENGALITAEKLPAGVAPSTDKTAGYVDGKNVYYPTVTDWVMNIGGPVRALDAQEIAANPIVKITPVVSDVKSLENAAFYTGIYYSESGVRPVLDTSGALTKYSSMNNFTTELANAADGSTVVLLTSGHEFSNDTNLTIAGKEISLDLNGNTLLHGSVSSTAGHDGKPFIKLNEAATFNLYSSKPGAAIYDMTFKSSTEIRSRGGFIYVNNGVDEVDITIGDFRGFSGKNLETNTGTLVYVYGNQESSTYTGAYLLGGEDITINVGGVTIYSPYYSAYAIFDFLAHDVKFTMNDSVVYNTHASYSIFHDYANNRTVSSDVKVYNSTIVSLTTSNAYGKIYYYIGPKSTAYFEDCTIIGTLAHSFYTGAEFILGKNNAVSTNTDLSLKNYVFPDGVVKLTSDSATTQKVSATINHANISIVLTGASTDSVILQGDKYVINQTEVLKRVTSTPKAKISFATYDPSDITNLPDAIVRSEWQNEKGETIDVIFDLSGNTPKRESLEGIVKKLDNGWYDIGYNGWKNVTDGSDGSLAYVEGKLNVFAPVLTPIAVLENMYANVSLYSHMGFSSYIAVPDASANIVFDVKNQNVNEAQQTGFFQIGKPTETLTSNNGTKVIEINGKTVSCYYDTVWLNADSYSTIQRLVRFEITECEFNGIEGIQDEEKNIYLEKVITIDFMAYYNKVVEIYGCDTDESRLMYSIVRLKEEINKVTNTLSDDAKAQLANFYSKFDSHTDCKCKYSFDSVMFSDEEKAITDASYAALNQEGILGVCFAVDISRPALVIYSTSNVCPTVTYKNAYGELTTHQDYAFTISENAEYEINGTMCYKITVGSIPAVSLSEIFNITYGNAQGQYSLATYITNNPDVEIAKVLYTYARATLNYKQVTKAESSSCKYGTAEHSYSWVGTKTGHSEVCSVCGKVATAEVSHTSSGPATTSSPEYCTVCQYEIEPKVSLEGKKFLFIGNSMTYYGRCVKSPSGSTNVLQSDRENDNGYFERLCNSNGYSVSVTNWTYGGHALGSILSDSCKADKSCNGYNHSQDLTDKYFDYVVFQEGTGVAIETTLAVISSAMEMFREANPDVKFIFLVPHLVYTSTTYANLRVALKEVEALGLTMVDWGRMVSDVYLGNVEVPGATQEYDKLSFVISKDGYHPNLLSGYITALMTYCTITGESAVGQSYSFCTNKQISDNIANYYTNGSTNMAEIFASASDMNGLQELADQYIAEKAYKTEIFENN